MVWHDLEVFLAVQRSGSHANAARVLKIDATTVGRRLTSLERTLATRLFDRTPQGLRLTLAGTALLPRAERVESELLAAERELEGADARLSGVVRVTAGDGLATYVLVPRLIELRRAYPDLEIELRADTRRLDLSRREADVALRLVRPKEPNLVARRLGSTPYGIYASRDYLARHGTPRTVAELQRRDWIAFRADVELEQNRWLERKVPGYRAALRVNTTTAQVAACRAGHGLALLPDFVSSACPDLVKLLPRSAGPSRELWLVVHQDLRDNGRVKRVVDWLYAISPTFTESPSSR